MKKKTYILTLIFLIGGFKIFACDCGYLGGFVYSNQAAEIVVYGTVIKYEAIGTHNSPDNPHSMKFLIKEKLRGIEIRDTIIVWGDYGADCRPYIEHFKPNTEWILALDKINNNGKNEYEISNCGEFYVPVKNEIVFGKIFGWNFEQKEKNYDYEQIRELVLNPWKNPMQRPEKHISKSSDGLENMTYCDNLPQNTLDFKTLSKLVNKEIELPTAFIPSGDSYLIHIRALIDENGKFHFNGTYGFNKTNDLISIENQISKILINSGTWKVGHEANEPVSSELIIPILLKR